MLLVGVVECKVAEVVRRGWVGKLKALVELIWLAGESP